MNTTGKSIWGMAAVASVVLVLSGCDQIHKARSRQLARSALEHFAKGDYDKALEVSEIAIRLGAEEPVLFAMRGTIFGFEHQPEKALEEFERGLEVAETAAAAPEMTSNLLTSRGNSLEILGRYRESLESFQKAVEVFDANSGAHNNIGWIFATIPLDSMRDGKRAIVHATRACELTKWKNAAFLDTLAAAFAEAGDFENALKWQDTASEFLDKNDEVNVRGFESRRKLYQDGKPYREDPKALYTEMVAKEKEAKNPPGK